MAATNRLPAEARRHNDHENPKPQVNAALPVAAGLRVAEQKRNRVRPKGVRGVRHFIEEEEVTLVFFEFLL